MGLLDWILRRFKGAPPDIDATEDPAPAAQGRSTSAPAGGQAPADQAPRLSKRERKLQQKGGKLRAEAGPARAERASTETAAARPVDPDRIPKKKRKIRKGPSAAPPPPLPPVAALPVAEPTPHAPAPHTPAGPSPAGPSPAPHAPAPRREPRPEPRADAPRPAPRNDQDMLAWVVMPKVEAALAQADQALAAPPLEDPSAERDRLRAARVQLDRAWERLQPLPEDQAPALDAARDARRTALSARFQALPDPRRAEEQAALDRRMAMLAEAEGLRDLPDLRVALDRARALQQEWKDAGRPPKGAPPDLSARWKQAMDDVYARREAERGLRLARLEGLVQQAEVLVRSPDPERAAEAMKALQQRWKDAGGVRGPDGDALWARFRGAADAVFAARGAALDQARARSVAAREALIAEALARAEEEVADPDEVVAELHRRWKRLGPAPRAQGDALWAGFRAACDRLRHPPGADPSLLGQDEGALRFSPFATLAAGAAAEHAPAEPAPAEPAPAEPAPPAPGDDPTDLVLPTGLRR